MKYILLCGLAGSLVSTIAFGFSTNFPMAIAARSINGLLNNIFLLLSHFILSFSFLSFFVSLFFPFVIFYYFCILIVILIFSFFFFLFFDI